MCNLKNEKITSLADIRYATMDDTIPTVLVSAYPEVENIDIKQDFNTTYQSFMSYFEENGDPANNGCSIKFTLMDDFHLDNEDKINNFFHLTTLIQLSPRLKAANANNA